MEVAMKVHVEVVSKAPPGGRCEIYDRFFFEVVRAYENVLYCLIPSNLFEGDITPPAVLINGEVIEPEDAVLLNPQEIVKALEERGAVRREGAKELLEKLESIYEEFLGG